DTPGAPDFVGNALGSLAAVETVVVVVSAVTRVEVNTRRMFAEAGKRGLARMLVINKLDAEIIDFDEVLSAVRAGVGKACVLFNAPINPGPDFPGVVSILKAPAGTPPGCPVDLAAAHTQLVEAVVEVDEALMEKYFAEGDISSEELLAA